MLREEYEVNVFSTGEKNIKERVKELLIFFEMYTEVTEDEE